jgi:predicted dehydrogenase
LKTVSGKPLIRPPWFFDVNQEGEGLVDVTTHLVDLVQWACFPDRPVRYDTDIRLLDADHWTTPVSLSQFREVTALDTFPGYLHAAVSGDTLHVYSNGRIDYTIGGIHANVSVTWRYACPEGGGDTHYSIMKGSKAHLIIEQTEAQGYTPVLYIRPTIPGEESFGQDLQAALEEITRHYPGVGIRPSGSDLWEVTVPEAYHNGHEAHFGQVMDNYLKYLKEGKLPSWEIPNMLAKYYVTTQALKLARSKAG